ncbi:MAG: glycosyltransferase family 39 protein, partial [Armatimonadota bacterium]
MRRSLYISIIVATALRLYRLGAQSIWGDESLTLLRYTGEPTFAAMWEKIWKMAFHPPLYFLTVYYWFRLGDSEWMLRFPSVVYGVASVPVMYALANRLFGRRTAAICAGVLAVSPIHIWYSQEARMYSLQLLLGLASTLFFVRIWQERRPIDGALWVLFTVLGLFAHIGTAFLLAAQGIFALLAAAKNRKRFAAWLSAQMLVALAFSPWLVRLWEARTGGISIGYERQQGVLDLLYSFFTFSLGFSAGPSVAELHYLSPREAILPNLPLILLSGLVFGALVVRGLALARKRAFSFGLITALLLVPVGLAVLASLVPGIPLNPRYILVSVIPYWIVIALGIEASRQGVWRVLPIAAGCSLPF